MELLSWMGLKNEVYLNIIPNKDLIILHFKLYIDRTRIYLKGKDILSRPNDLKNIFKRRKDITDPLEILLNGYKNTFKE